MSTNSTLVFCFSALMLTACSGSNPADTGAGTASDDGGTSDGDGTDDGGSDDGGSDDGSSDDGSSGDTGSVSDQELTGKMDVHWDFNSELEAKGMVDCDLSIQMVHLSKGVPTGCSGCDVMSRTGLEELTTDCGEWLDQSEFEGMNWIWGVNISELAVYLYEQSEDLWNKVCDATLDSTTATCFSSYEEDGMAMEETIVLEW